MSCKHGVKNRNEDLDALESFLFCGAAYREKTWKDDDDDDDDEMMIFFFASETNSSIFL